MDFINEKTWEYEQNFFQDTYSGYRYIISRSDVIGVLCGYVELKTKKWQKIAERIGYEGMYEIVFTHGGVTYVGYIRGNSIWVGFDCGHSFDLIPNMVNERSKSLFSDANLELTYRDLRYVRKVCKDMIKQIKELESK